MERYRDHQKDLHIVFIDLENSYDRISIEVLWKVLEKKGVQIAYIIPHILVRLPHVLSEFKISKNGLERATSD